MKKLFFILMLALIGFLLMSCENSFFSNENAELSKLDSLALKDQMDFFSFQNILLGDGVPLGVDLAIRWKITDPEVVLSQFTTVTEFKNYVLQTRGKELMNEAFNEFDSVDSIFSSQRPVFIESLKAIIHERLGEEGISIKEVICSQINFPKTYTTAMEQAGLQRQELERINQQNIIAIALAKAEETKSEATAKVDIVKAKAEGRVEKIKAETEKNRRQSLLASAETEKQIAYKRSQTEADRLKLLAKADLEKVTDLKKLDVQHEKDMVEVEVEKKKKIAKADFEVQQELADVFQNNPVYASYLVNKELASKVKIAVLPTGSDPNVFGNLLQQMIPVSGEKK